MGGLRTFGVPKKHAEPIEGGHQLTETTALREARAWWAASSPLLVLAGHVGTGKSLAAAWLVQQRWLACCASQPGDQLRVGGLPIWLGAPLLSRVSTWGDGAARIASWRDTMLLVLDDLGVEDASDRTNALLDDLVNHRSENALATIITTNVGPGAFVKRYGTRIRDRVRGCGLTSEGLSRWWVECDGDGTRDQAGLPVSLRGRVEPTPPPPGEEPEAEDGPFVSIARMREEVERLRVEFAAREEEQEKRIRRQIEEEQQALIRRWGKADA